MLKFSTVICLFALLRIEIIIYLTERIFFTLTSKQVRDMLLYSAYPVKVALFVTQVANRDLESAILQRINGTVNKKNSPNRVYSILNVFYKLNTDVQANNINRTLLISELRSV